MNVRVIPAIHFAARGWVLAIAFAFLLWARLNGNAPPQPRYLALAAAGIALRLWAGAHLGAHGNAARAGAPALATSGPYALSRNPLYLANMAVAAGLIFFANVLPGTAAAAVLILLFAHHRALAKWEEARLGELFGEQYAAYAARVPRWFSFRPPAPGGEEDRGRIPLRETLARQGRNVGYALAGIGILWIAAR